MKTPRGNKVCKRSGRKSVVEVGSVPGDSLGRAGSTAQVVFLSLSSLVSKTVAIPNSALRFLFLPHAHSPGSAKLCLALTWKNSNGAWTRGNQSLPGSTGAQPTCQSMPLFLSPSHSFLFHNLFLPSPNWLWSKIEYILSCLSKTYLIFFHLFLFL